ncbi:MAG TPA: metallophosphoesterase family protein [Oceanipulchritudo sp.]|nr:metallophosphoesterase family protein [Oceanipulchritudo sp.]
MIKFTYPAFLALLLPAMLVAHEGADHADWKPAQYPAAQIHAPTPVPDRVILTWNNDPATTQAVTWRTDTTVHQGCAELAVANSNGRALKPERFPAETTLLVSDLNEAHYHTVTFDGLSPDTLYAYRVGDGENWSEYFHFRTASRDDKPFSFIYFGDSQNEHKTHWSRVFREAFRDAPRAAFTLHAGDLINKTNRDAEWGEWHGAPAWVNGTIPVIATPGNHDYDKKDTPKPVVCSHWRPQFAFPVQDPPAGLEETCYYIDYQGARIISLDSIHDLEAQAVWLRKVLAHNTQRWTIITFHHPVFAPSADRDFPVLRGLWKPLFDEFKVDLVLNGHDHVYARTGDVSGRAPGVNVPEGYQQAYDPAIGTVYVVSMSGPKLYAIGKGKETFAARFVEKTQLYQVVEVDHDELRFRAYSATGELYDAFRLIKRSGQANQLIEMELTKN